MNYIYIAGPYSGGDVAVNVRNAIGAANRLVDAGYKPFVPHLCHFWHLLYPRPYEDWVALDMAWLPKCEAIVRLDGDSPGADGEVQWALTNNIPVYYGVDAFFQANGKALHPTRELAEEGP